MILAEPKSATAARHARVEAVMPSLEEMSTPAGYEATGQRWMEFGQAVTRFAALEAWLALSGVLAAVPHPTPLP